MDKTMMPNRFIRSIYKRPLNFQVSSILRPIFYFAFMRVSAPRTKKVSQLVSQGRNVFSMILVLFFLQHDHLQEPSCRQALMKI
jgi:hypothetical protein